MVYDFLKSLQLKFTLCGYCFDMCRSATLFNGNNNSNVMHFEISQSIQHVSTVPYKDNKVCVSTRAHVFAKTFIIRGVIGKF